MRSHAGPRAKRNETSNGIYMEQHAIESPRVRSRERSRILRPLCASALAAFFPRAHAAALCLLVITIPFENFYIHEFILLLPRILLSLSLFRSLARSHTQFPSSFHLCRNIYAFH